jgi:plasmid stabilization system protein ParE
MQETVSMPRGDKSKYTDKQKRQAEKIEEGYKKRGVSSKEAVSRAWATVNKESGGGKKSGSGRKKSSSGTKKSSKKSTSSRKKSSSGTKKSS